MPLHVCPVPVDPPAVGLAHIGGLGGGFLNRLAGVAPEGTNLEDNHALTLDPVSEIELVPNFHRRPALGHEV